MNHEPHNIAGNGKCDGLKSFVDWAISSQAADGLAMSDESVEGSTSRSVSANNNRTQERPSAEAAYDVLSSLIERQRSRIKSRFDKNAERRRAVVVSGGICYSSGLIPESDRVILRGSFWPSEELPMSGKSTRSIKERFEEKFEKQQATGCWLWKAARQGSSGYGMFWYNSDLRDMGAHQASHLIYKGPIPVGMVVMHACDDRRCVNPDHLEAGTQLQNMQDMAKRGRSARGDRNGNALLDDVIVSKIKAEYVKRDGELIRLANKYNVEMNTIANIVGGHAWKHVQVEFGSDADHSIVLHRKSSGSKHHRAKLTEDQVREMRAGYECGALELDDIVIKYGIKKAQACAIVNRKAWTHLP